MEKRGSFSNKMGFVLAAAGSAVGLGNIWRFSYLAAKYGGGIFILIYILLVVTLGFTLMIAEIAIGRKTGLSPIGAQVRLFLTPVLQLWRHLWLFQHPCDLGFWTLWNRWD